MNTIRLAFAVANPDLQVIEGGHPEPEIRRGPGLQKMFLALHSSVWSKNKGGMGPSPPGPYPGSATSLGNLITGVLTYYHVILTQS